MRPKNREITYLFKPIICLFIISFKTGLSVEEIQQMKLKVKINHYSFRMSFY